MHRQWSPRALSLVAAGACILFGLAGCSSAADTSGKEGGEGADPALLEATDWRATEIAGAPAIADAEAPDVTAVFAAGTMSGSGGVNRYTAEYEVGEDGAITISRPAATLMAGPPDLMEREAAYFEAHQGHWDYAAKAERGEPIGSGAMESGCKQYQLRFKRPGQFWAHEEGLLELYSRRMSGRWDSLWPHLSS